MKLNTALIFLIFSLPANCGYGQNLRNDTKPAYRTEVTALKGMAVTSHPLATQAAIDILKLGGSAVDAAIAANAVLGLVNPMNCGIGSDLSALVWDSKTNQLHGLDANGVAPAALTNDYFRKHKLKEIPRTGPLSIIVPGCAGGWDALHKKFGKLSTEEILQPAISYAEEGFPLSESASEQWRKKSETYKTQVGFAAVFMPGGKTPEKGEIFQNKALAQTYRHLAEAGIMSFYEGELATELVRVVDSCGGILQTDDFIGFKSEWVKPIATNYRGFEVWQMPPNSRGYSVLETLNMLENINISAMKPGEKALVHQIVEMQKIALDDSDKWLREEAPLNLDRLIAKTYAAERMKAFQPEKAGKSVSSNFSGNTMAFISIADKEGNMVALVQGNDQDVRYGITLTNLGFIVQSHTNGYTIQSGKPNSLTPGRRPLSNLLPTFITKDGQPWLSLCFGDGDLQVQGQIQMAINLIDFNMPLRSAAAAVMFLHEAPERGQNPIQNETGWLKFEPGINYETIRELMKMGHRIRFGNIGNGGMGAILRNPSTGVYYGISTLGAEGQAAGY